MSEVKTAKFRVVRPGVYVKQEGKGKAKPRKAPIGATVTLPVDANGKCENPVYASHVELMPDGRTGEKLEAAAPSAAPAKPAAE